MAPHPSTPLATLLPAPGGSWTITPTLSDQNAQHPVGRAGGAGRVDYSLARRATLRAYSAGRVSRFDICDAHPDLLRAARFCGTPTPDPCPICERGPLVLVAYAFSDEFPQRENGRVWAEPDIRPLLKLREARLYTVEVCQECSWNHLRSQIMFAKGRTRRAQGVGGRRRGRAST